VLDHVVVTQLAGLRPGLLQELTAVWESSLPAQLDALQAAVTARDPVTTTGCAHRLRGSSASLGARQVAELADRLEAGEGDPQALLRQLVGACATAVRALRSTERCS
jgi:HPt (histidine-containing phosphotransfer) domain-containing protein